MSVNIVIKPNDFNPVKMSVIQIAKLLDLGYGVSDSHYCLDRGKTGEYNILYDKSQIGRGIECWLEQDNVCLRLPLPTTGHDIDLFYKLVEEICRRMDVYFFECEGETVPITDLYAHVDDDKEASMASIRHIAHRTSGGDNKYLILFGAINPVYIGEAECDEIGDTLEGFDKLMHRLQSGNAFYATPRFYKRPDGSLFGMYYVGENMPVTVPLEPASPFHKIENLNEYYVRLPDGNDLPYKDFIDNIPVAAYYDAGHITVSLKESDIQMLVDNYTVDTDTKKRKKGVYWGKVLDSGNFHSRKVSDMALDTDKINGYNHLAVFLRWAKENQFISFDLITACPQILLDNMDLRALIADHPAFNGCLRINHFRPEIKDFVKSFYVFGNNGYPGCVDKYAEKVLGTEKYNCEEYKDEAYLFVPYDEEYYKGLSEYIIKAFKEFNNK